MSVKPGQLVRQRCPGRSNTRHRNGTDPSDRTGAPGPGSGPENGTDPLAPEIGEIDDSARNEGTPYLYPFQRAERPTGLSGMLDAIRSATDFGAINGRTYVFGRSNCPRSDERQGSTVGIYIPRLICTSQLVRHNTIPLEPWFSGTVSSLFYAIDTVYRFDCMQSMQANSIS